MINYPQNCMFSPLCTAFLICASFFSSFFFFSNFRVIGKGHTAEDLAAGVAITLGKISANFPESPHNKELQQ